MFSKRCKRRYSELKKNWRLRLLLLVTLIATKAEPVMNVTAGVIATIVVVTRLKIDKFKV